jgi:23S rRNA (cytosine1962-C5)-methyltransferase
VPIATPNAAKTPRLRLRVSPTAESILRSGHPWLFAESIREQNRPGVTGELAVIYDRRDHFLAAGLFDADSPIRVRILHTGKPQAIDSDWWRARLETALARRRGLFDAQTTGWRWLNGESDGWPGLVLDRYDTALALKLYTAAWLPRLNEIVPLISAALPNERLILRLSRNIQRAAEQFKLSDGKLLKGAPLNGPMIFFENGLRFEADVAHGQKTGFFLDQRENRKQIETLSRGRDVVNVFSFTGGFSVYAARGGAVSVTDVDISSHALAGAKRNLQLNHALPEVARCRHETAQADAFEWLATKPSRKFGLIVLDPPSFAKRETERAGALRAYERLITLAVPWLARDSVLMAASCSAHVSADEFFDAVRRAVSASGRKHAVTLTTGHAPDHHAAFAEMEYLKAIYFTLH